ALRAKRICSVSLLLCGPLPVLRASVRNLAFLLAYSRGRVSLAMTRIPVHGASAEPEHGGIPMDPIKRPTRYKELADPQARPRYTGISTFFRTPHTESLGEVDIGVIGVP